MKIYLAAYFLMLIFGTVAVDSFGHLLARSDNPADASGNQTGAPSETPAKPPARGNQPAPAAVKNQPPAAQPAPAAEAGKRLPPLPENLKPTGKHQAWGFTKARIITSAGELQGGTFLEFPDINEIPLVAFYFANRFWNGPVVVPEDKVILFGGTLEGADPADLRLFQRYYYLLGQLEPPAVSTATPDAPATATAAAATNPFETEYKAIAKQYLDFQERTKTLTAQRDSASGANRTKIINDLHKMKQEEPDLIRDLKAVQDKYNDWKKKNPGAAAAAPAPKPAPPATPPAAAPDPARAAEYREELRQLEPDVRRILN